VASPWPWAPGTAARAQRTRYHFIDASPVHLLTIEDIVLLKRVRSCTTVYAIVRWRELPEPWPEDKVPRWRLSDLMPSDETP